MRERWTTSPVLAANHVIDAFSSHERASILDLWSGMSRGGDGGQIEPWGPSIRTVIYPDWSDADFSIAISNVKDLAG